jgi:hypothetical protein
LLAQAQMHERPGTLPPSVYDSGTNFTLTPVSEEGSKMMRSRAFATLGVAGVMCASFVGMASVSQAAPSSNDKVTICHRTGSATNPYVAITVSKAGAANHLKNHDGTLNWPAAPYKPKVLTVGGDFIADPATGCTVPPVTQYPGPFVPCVVSAGVIQDAVTVVGTTGSDTIDCSAASPGKTITGNGGVGDTITGTQFGDRITTGAGNDTITGLGGNDVINGGDGNNTVTGGDGDDTVTTGSGNDTITGGPGTDVINSGTGSDTVTQ